uniref:Glycolipid transfer protein domain-containing protein n=1 Tax=Spermophilus dauricus TaxID=99837 RepID=A0A8C9Q5L8_SPEDA
MAGSEGSQGHQGRSELGGGSWALQPPVVFPLRASTSPSGPDSCLACANLREVTWTWTRRGQAQTPPLGGSQPGMVLQRDRAAPGSHVLMAGVRHGPGQCPMNTWLTEVHNSDAGAPPWQGALAVDTGPKEPPSLGHRGLRFIQVFLQSICDGERDENHPNLIRVNATKAYEMALKKYHGWIVQKIFQAALAVRSALQVGLPEGPLQGAECDRGEGLEKIRLFLVNYTATIDVIYEMYTKMNAELNYKV